MTQVWRQGRKVPHHVYEQRGAEPDNRPWPDGDRPVATFFDPADAERVCEAINHLRDNLSLQRLWQELARLRRLRAAAVVYREKQRALIACGDEASLLETSLAVNAEDDAIRALDAALDGEETP